MVLYGVALLPLIKHMRAEDRSVLQPWYADDAAMQGRAQRQAKLLRRLSALGPAHGYFPEPKKSIYVCREEDEAAARAAFEAEGLAVRFSRGTRYVGGFVDNNESLREWVAPQVVGWASGVRALAHVARRF